MDESIEGSNTSTPTTIRRIQELAGFNHAPLALAGAGLVVTVLSSLLPYASVSISVFGGNIGAFEGSSPSAWFLSLPIGWVALFLAVTIVGCAVALVASDNSPGSEHVLATVMTGSGLFLLGFEFLELFWVQHRVNELAGFFGGDVDTTLAIGYLGLLFGAALLTLGGTAALVRANSKRIDSSDLLS